MFSRRDPPAYNAAIRYYSEYNATIMLCVIHTLQFPLEIQEFCVDQALQRAQRGVLIINIGIIHILLPYSYYIGSWYKPKDIFNHFKYLNGTVDDIKRDIVGFRTNLFKISGYNHSDYSKSNVIWYLNGHAGPIDEYRSLGRSGFHHKNGPYWDNTTCAQWVSLYNSVIKDQANIFGDFVIDTLDIFEKLRAFQSKEFDQFHHFSFYESVKAYLHADSIHFCAGGIQRATLLVLQELLQHRRSCS